jgi:hypothetical protein
LIHIPCEGIGELLALQHDGKQLPFAFMDQGRLFQEPSVNGRQEQVSSRGEFNHRPLHRRQIGFAAQIMNESGLPVLEFSSHFSEIGHPMVILPDFFECLL